LVGVVEEEVGVEAQGEEENNSLDEEKKRERKVVKATFKDGTTMLFDYLIGGDGANSIVRQSYRAPSMHYHDLGYTNIAGVAPLSPSSSSSFPLLLDNINKGLCRYLGADGHTLLMFKFHPDGTIGA